VLVEQRPRDWPAVFAVDASTWEGCDAETSPERGFYYHASKHSAGQPIVAGWSYQWICQLSWAPDSWTAPVDARRIPVDADVTDATAAQVRELASLQPTDDDRQVPLFVFDAGYDPIGLSHALADEDVQVLVHSHATTACSMPTRPNATRRRWAGRAVTAPGSSAATPPPGPHPTTSRWPPMLATAPNAASPLPSSTRRLSMSFSRVATPSRTRWPVRRWRATAAQRYLEEGCGDIEVVRALGGTAAISLTLHNRATALATDCD
jgi:hypothetical protein